MSCSSRKRHLDRRRVSVKVQLTCVHRDTSVRPTDFSLEVLSSPRKLYPTRSGKSKVSYLDEEGPGCHPPVFGRVCRRDLRTLRSSVQEKFRVSSDPRIVVVRDDRRSVSPASTCSTVISHTTSSTSGTRWSYTGPGNSASSPTRSSCCSYNRRCTQREDSRSYRCSTRRHCSRCRHT